MEKNVHNDMESGIIDWSTGGRVSMERVPIIRITVCLGVFLGRLLHGNHHIELLSIFVLPGDHSGWTEGSLL